MKNKLIRFCLNKLFIVYLFLIPFFTFGQDAATVENPIDADSLPDLIKMVLEGVIKMGIPVLVLAIIFNGFLFVSAQGNEEKLKKAKTSLTYTVVGAALLLGAWGLSILIAETVNKLQS